MAFLRTPSATLVLLLALIVPLQSFAAVWGCGAHAGTAAVHHHCANDPAKAQGGAEQHHHCGTCCAAAIALMPFRWTAPPSANAQVSLSSLRPPPQGTLDRLDRPPRLV